MSFLKSYLKNLLRVSLIVLAIAGCLFVFCLPILLGEWLGDWAAWTAFAVYFFVMVAVGTAADR